MLVELVGGPDDGAVHMVPDEMINRPIFLEVAMHSLAQAVAGEVTLPVATIRYTYIHTQKVRDNGTLVYQLAETEVRNAD